RSCRGSAQGATSLPPSSRCRSQERARPRSPSSSASSCKTRSSTAPARCAFSLRAETATLCSQSPTKATAQATLPPAPGSRSCVRSCGTSCTAISICAATAPRWCSRYELPRHLRPLHASDGGDQAASSFGPMTRMRILVAEDETIIRLDLRDLLERAGFEICAEARDGEEAVALARSEQPDLAIMDVKMPRLDGIEAARRILDENPIPIVMLTAYGQEELVSRAVEAGVFGYLVKPFREQDLLPAIQA